MSQREQPDYSANAYAAQPDAPTQQPFQQQFVEQFQQQFLKQFQQQLIFQQFLRQQFVLQ